MVYLAWFSNLTHIACLTALRGYLHQHQLERNWRLFFMTVLWAGLISAMIPTVFFNWSSYWEPSASRPSSNARCFFDLDVGRDLFFNDSFVPCLSSDSGFCPFMLLTETAAMQSATISILLLGFSYVSRTVKLTKRLSDGIHTTIRRRTSNWYTKRLAKRIDKIATNPRPSVAARRVLNLILVKFRIALYLMVKMYANMLTSDASDVCSSPRLSPLVVTN